MNNEGNAWRERCEQAEKDRDKWLEDSRMVRRNLLDVVKFCLDEIWMDEEDQRSFMRAAGFIHCKCGGSGWIDVIFPECPDDPSTAECPCAQTDTPGWVAIK